MDVDDLVTRARAGDRAALTGVVREVKDLVYNLAIRMLGDPADAEDATQEILIRVVTSLSSFRGDSAFRTWVYRVASNYLLTTRKRSAESRNLSFEAIAAQLDAGLKLASDAPPVEDALLKNEVKLFCTTGMLLCLDRDHRIAFVLGEIVELSGDEAAAILEISGDAYRKRLSRARQRMAEFLTQNCGLVDGKLPCSCGRQAVAAMRLGLIDPERLRWAGQKAVRVREQARVDAIDHLTAAAAVFRSHPEYAAPDALVDGMRRLLDGGALD